MRESLKKMKGVSATVKHVHLVYIFIWKSSTVEYKKMNTVGMATVSSPPFLIMEWKREASVSFKTSLFEFKGKKKVLWFGKKLMNNLTE